MGHRLPIYDANRENGLKNRTHTLYFQIAALYLLLLTVFAAASIVFVYRQLEDFFCEVEQRVNRDLALNLSHELKPELTGRDPSIAALAVERIHKLNPRIDLYVLDSHGSVSRSLNGKPPLRNRVDLTPIKAFLDSRPLPIRAIDPGRPDEKKIFSVVPLAAALGGGYLYVILPGMPFDTAIEMARSSYVIRGASGVLAAIFVATLAAGMIFFFVLTKRFRRLILAVKKFQEGELDTRVDADAPDQIGKLGATFNEMAATIQAQLEALKRTDEARKAIAANISHDFRTPLTALRGYADRMLRVDERLQPAERKQYLNAILQSAAQLERLSDQLSLIVKLDGSDHTTKKEPFSIAELAQDAIIKYSASAEQRGVRLSLSNPQGTPFVLGDIALIERVLSNLIDNALQHTGPDGGVEISLPISNSHVTCAILDTGCGIGKEDLSRIMHRFYRTRASVAASVPGTGLGLAIVEQILSIHDSKLHVESEIHVGTRVWFELPIAGADHGTAVTGGVHPSSLR